MGNGKISLGDRMKCYEGVSNIKLMRRTPVIIRLDGKAFHSFTKGFIKPFDRNLWKAMTTTTAYLCENIQGCVLGYTQSDEITLVLCDYQSLDTDAWYDNKIQKIVSVASSLATFKFNNYFTYLINNLEQYGDFIEDDSIQNMTIDEFSTYLNKLDKASKKGALFDARAFNVPKEEVCNNLIWRQRDAENNSVQSLAQSLYSHKELQGLSVKSLQDKIFTEKGINWNDLPIYQKRGTTVIKDENSNWVIDFDAPIFSQDREYIESRINFKEVND